MPLPEEPAWRQYLDELNTFLPQRDGQGSGVFAALSKREAEVLEQIAQGVDNAQIAARLELRDKTVRNRITSIFAKLQVDDRARAIVLAREAGFGQKAH